MYRYKIYFFFFLFSFLKIPAQQLGYKTGKITIQKHASVNIASKKDPWNAFLQHIDPPAPGGEKSNEALQEIKRRLQARYPRKEVNFKKEHNVKYAPSPSVERNFVGNATSSGSPLDNDVAISKSGVLVSVINQSIYIYDINAPSQPIKSLSLEAFATANPNVPINPISSNVNNKFDPKVIYDPEADRFILVMLNGYNVTYSRIIVAFSQTNDPAGDWNIYVLPGNPLNNNLWSDYPQIAITKEDFFITINLLVDSNIQGGGQKPWEKAFRDDLIWQINKEEGYSGVTSINPNYYHDLTFNGKLIQYICPVKSGDDILESNLYLLSNKPFTLGSDSIFLMEIPNSLSSGLNEIRLLYASSDVSYYVPPDVKQPGNGDSLFTNDARILGGFYHKNQIQFVFPTLDTVTGVSSIYHGIIKNISSSSFTVKGNILTKPGYEFGYPNISFSGEQNVSFDGVNSEPESIITFNHSSAQKFPGISAVFYNKDASYSEIIEVKKGDTIINANNIRNQKERWGDYTGSQRYGSTGAVWISGTYGDKGTNGNLRRAGTWIAELKTPNAPVNIANENQLLVFPNPSKDVFSFGFKLDKTATLNIKICSLTGAVVKEFLYENAKQGDVVFSFSAEVLLPSTYVVMIMSEGEVIFKKTMVKA